MYQKIHDELYGRLAKKNDFRLTARRLNIGKALKQLKASNRIKMHDLIEATHLKRGCLNALMQSGETNTSRDRFLKIVQALRVPADEFIRLARETARYNFYPTERSRAPVFKYRNYEAEILSPPTFNRKDFMWCHIRILPGSKIPDLIHQTMEQIAGFVTHGHLKLAYGDKNYTIHTNQSFYFDPKTLHGFHNEAASGTTEFYLVYQLRSEPRELQTVAKETAASNDISTAALIEQIRRELSPDPNRPIPMPELAALSGIGLDALMHLTHRETKIIPFEKIDLLASLTDYSFEHIVQKAERQYRGWVKIFTDQDKTVIDQSLRYGVSFTNHTGLGIGRRKFSIADVSFESWRDAGARKKWEYQGLGFIGIAAQRGFVGIQYGKQPLHVLKWGETLYLNTDVPITLVNLLGQEEAVEKGESGEAKAILFTSPPIF